MVIPRFNNGVLGMDAYGEKSEDMIVAIPRKEFSTDFIYRRDL